MAGPAPLQPAAGARVLLAQLQLPSVRRFVRWIFKRKLVARARARVLYLYVAVCDAVSRLRTPHSCAVGHSDGGERNRD